MATKLALVLQNIKHAFAPHRIVGPWMASGRPIMVALDALGRRGALRLLWELRDGPLTFRALQTACDTNPARSTPG